MGRTAAGARGGGRLAALLLALALPAAAQEGAERVAPEEFEALSVGRTLHFSREDGAPHGAEQYLPGRRAIWQTPDGRCLFGRWEASGDELCFAYDDAPWFWQCWEVWRDERGLYARLAGAAPGADLRVTGESDRPLVCDPEDRSARASPPVHGRGAS